MTRDLNNIDIDFEKLEEDYNKLKKIIINYRDNYNIDENIYGYKKIEEYKDILSEIRSTVGKAKGVTSAYRRDEKEKYYYPYEKVELIHEHLNSVHAEVIDHRRWGVSVASCNQTPQYDALSGGRVVVGSKL